MFPPSHTDRSNVNKCIWDCTVFSQPVPLWGGLRQRVGIMFLCFSVCVSVCLSAVIFSSSSSPSSLEEGSSRTCVGAVPRDLSLYDIMSGIRLLLHSNTVSCTILCREMFPREYLPTHGRDDSSTAGVFQCTVLYHTILYKTFCAIAAIPS